MFKKFFVIGAAALTMIATNTLAADVSRVRLMVPVQASDAASYDTSTKPDSVSASGFSLQYVHSSGVGIGYTSSTLKKGTAVRIIRDPYFGLIGEIYFLPSGPQTLESGTKTRVLDVLVKNGDIITVPRANIERIEG